MFIFIFILCIAWASGTEFSSSYLSRPHVILSTVVYCTIYCSNTHPCRCHVSRTHFNVTLHGERWSQKKQNSIICDPEPNQTMDKNPAAKAVTSSR